MQQSQPTTLGLGHRRSASDSSLALQQHAINIQMCPGESFSTEVSDPFTKKSLFPLDENASSEDELPLVLNDLTRTEPQSAYQHKWSREIDPSINPKKMKRWPCILSSFLSSYLIMISLLYVTLDEKRKEK
jgi:hypothetical protein